MNSTVRQSCQPCPVNYPDRRDMGPDYLDDMGESGLRFYKSHLSKYKFAKKYSVS